VENCVVARPWYHKHREEEVVDRWVDTQTDRDRRVAKGSAAEGKNISSRRGGRGVHELGGGSRQRIGPWPIRREIEARD